MVDPLIGPAQIAKRRGVSVRTARRWILAANHELNGILIQSAPGAGRRRQIRIRKSAADQLFPELPAMPTAAEALEVIGAIREMNARLDAMRSDVDTLLRCLEARAPRAA